MISTNELSFPMPAANLIAQRDPMRFVDTALYADDCAAESVTLVRADFLAADACGRFPAVALIEIMAQTIGIYAGRLQRLAGEPPAVGGAPCRVPAGSAALNVFNPPAGYFERLEDSTR